MLDRNTKKAEKEEIGRGLQLIEEDGQLIGPFAIDIVYASTWCFKTLLINQMINVIEDHRKRT